jgi:hypothetical protein
MAPHEQVTYRFAPLRIAAFRVFGGALLAFAVLGLASAGVGVFYTLRQTSSSGWFPPLLIGLVGVACALMAVVGVRALRVKTVGQLEEQSKSKWIDV